MNAGGPNRVDATGATGRRSRVRGRTGRRERRGDRETSHDVDQRRIELYELRDAVRQRFHKDNGYKRYVDSTGREVWLSPQEYDQRTRRRKRRRRTAPLDAPLASRTRTVMLYGCLALLAAVIGVALTR